MSNNIETVYVPPADGCQGGTFTFDHETLMTKAVYDDGSSEHWAGNGYSYKAKLMSFCLMTDQDERFRKLCEED